MDLAVKTRATFGKAVKTLRKQGLIPAVLYGRGVPNKSLTVDAKEFKKLFKEAGENTVVNLALEDGKKHPTLIHEVQRDFISNEVQHVDFHEVRMDEKIKAPIPIVFTGESPAIKSLGGILNRSMDEIEVEALPGDLPQAFTVDLSALAELNQSIYVKDIVAPRAVKIMVDPETVIATVTEPVKEEEIVAPPEPADVSAVKVESEEKKEGRAKEKTAGELEGGAETAAAGKSASGGKAPQA